MADPVVTEDPSGESLHTPKAPKDRNCPYCGQSFTSSSLGRHLDLYIKDKNPKPPDGIHNVDEIKKLRGTITRRQPRGSLRRDASTPSRPSITALRKSPTSEDTEHAHARSPATMQASDSIGRTYPFNTPWEATGVINDIADKAPSEGGRSEREGSSDRARHPPQTQRTMSRQMMKSQVDLKHKMQDAADTARAAELALREIMSSIRAAKQHLDFESMPFEFDPLALDFPALCLVCLETPPTLFASTQHPTATSWSILPPGAKQLEALQNYFYEEFKRWRLTCASATTAYTEDLVYPPATDIPRPDYIKEAVHKAEQRADEMEVKVRDHLASMFDLWQSLQDQQRQEYWVLELARSIGRKQKEVDSLREEQHNLKQENANLRTQVEHLNRLQQPREFRAMPPATIAMPKGVLDYFWNEGIVKGRSGVGFNMNDRHSDLNTIVATAIDRWKNVIVSSRTTGGMQAQRSFDTNVEDEAGAESPLPQTTWASSQQERQTQTTRRQSTVRVPETPQPVTRPQTQPRLESQQPATPQLNGASNPGVTEPQESSHAGVAMEAPMSVTNGTAASASASAEGGINEEDADGDAEMDDDPEYRSIPGSVIANVQPKAEPRTPTLPDESNHATGQPVSDGANAQPTAGDDLAEHLANGIASPAPVKPEGSQPTGLDDPMSVD